MHRNKFLNISLVVAILVACAPAAVVQTTSPAKAKASSSGQAASKNVSAGKSQAGEGHDLAASDLRAIKTPPLPEFHPQQPKRFELSNGMVIFLQEDHELPLIDANAIVRGGSINEPQDKAGLVSIYGLAWRTGGTKSKTGDEADDLLEARAAKIETSGLQLYTNISISCLKGDFDFVLDLFQDFLRNPQFRQEKIDLAKDQLRTGIARRNDGLGQIAQREANKIGYGADSPYARVPEYATVAAVTRQDLLDW